MSDLSHPRLHETTPVTEPMPRPPIIVSSDDYGRLTWIATGSMMGRFRSRAGAFLADELVRAEVRPPGEIPASVAVMRSVLAYHDETSGEVSRVRIVYPDEDDGRPGTASVLTDTGAALLGLSEGQSISLADDAGALRRLTVLSVEQPAISPIAGPHQ
jgi:regulator of nucleoside diphosphate kinase